MRFPCFLYKQSGSEMSMKWKVKLQGWPDKPYTAAHLSEKYGLHCQYNRSIVVKKKVSWLLLLRSDLLAFWQLRQRESKGGGKTRQNDLKTKEAAFSLPQTFAVCLPPWQECWSWRRWRLWTHLPRQSWAVEKTHSFWVMSCVYELMLWKATLSDALFSKSHKKPLFLLSLSNLT